MSVRRSIDRSHAPPRSVSVCLAPSRCVAPSAALAGSVCLLLVAAAAASPFRSIPLSLLASGHPQRLLGARDRPGTLLAGNFNSWDRLPFITNATGTVGTAVVPTVMERNFVISNYASTWPIDHDDCSCECLALASAASFASATASAAAAAIAIVVVAAAATAAMPVFDSSSN